MKIIDTTTFYKENLMMELRMNILSKFVDYFVICESKYSHSGKKKKLYFDINKFKDFKKKIIYLVCENEPEDLNSSKEFVPYIERQNSIKRIAFQRNFIQSCFENFSNNDFILYSDNDEIPNIKHQNFFEDDNKIYIFKQKLFYYKLNLILPSVDWYGTKGCTIKNLKNINWLRNIKNKKYSHLRIDTLFSKDKYQNIKIIDNGGWHFSNLKTIEDLNDKYLNDENHADYSNLMSIKNIQEDVASWQIGIDHNEDKRSNSKLSKVKLVKEDVSSLPEFIVNNKNNYDDWIV